MRSNFQHPLHAAIVEHRDFAHFSPREREDWERGEWREERHEGRFGWWWSTGGLWFFYNAPVYPYPTYVSTYYYEEPSYSNDYSQYWYYCENPAGYYPYVRSCDGPWEPVPASPQGAGPAYDGQGPSPEMGDQGAPE